MNNIKYIEKIIIVLEIRSRIPMRMLKIVEFNNIKMERMIVIRRMYNNLVVKLTTLIN